MSAILRTISARDDGAVLARWATVHAASMLGAVLLAAALRTALPVALVATASYLVFAQRAATVSALSAPFGSYANMATALRLVLVLGAAASLSRIPTAWLLAVLVCNVALDVADGRLARRFGHASRFGAALDREADATFVLVAYLYLFLRADFSAWVLVPGVLPYAYRCVAWIGGEASAQERREPLAVVLAGANYVLLLAAVAAMGSAQARIVVASVSVVALSFLISFARLRGGNPVS